MDTTFFVQAGFIVLVIINTWLFMQNFMVKRVRFGHALYLRRVGKIFLISFALQAGLMMYDWHTTKNTAGVANEYWLILLVCFLISFAISVYMITRFSASDKQTEAYGECQVPNIIFYSIGNGALLVVKTMELLHKHF